MTPKNSDIFSNFDWGGSKVYPTATATASSSNYYYDKVYSSDVLKEDEKTKQCKREYEHSADQLEKELLEKLCVPAKHQQKEVEAESELFFDPKDLDI